MIDLSPMLINESIAASLYFLPAYSKTSVPYIIYTNTQELDSMILLCPFQIEMFYDSMK